MTLPEPVEKGLRAIVGRGFDELFVRKTGDTQVKTAKIVALNQSEQHHSGSNARLYCQIELLGSDIAVVQKKEDFPPDDPLYPVNGKAWHIFVYYNGGLADSLEQLH